jgi:hypothetical protein
VPSDEIFLLAFCATLLTTTGCAMGWIRSARENLRLREQIWRVAAGQDPAAFAESSEVPAARGGVRLERLEAQVETLSHQLERMTDAQDFLSRVLTDRIDRFPDPRSRTPH